VADKLRDLGVGGILVLAAEQGYITELRCGMPKCLHPLERGGPTHFDPVTHPPTDWMPTHEHFPRPKHGGGHRDVDNAVLAHPLCNRIDYSLEIGRPHQKDLDRVETARQEAIRQSH
jgi:hypothetical protein